MSDYLAVGGVSAVLCSLLSSALTAGGPSTVLGSSTPGVTAVSPDLITTGAEEKPQLNLFMYYVSLNPALRNLDLPSANAQGDRISNPPLALNLHYLVSAYGAQQFDPEILLAWAMKVFHDTPVVPPAMIQAALTGLLAGSPSAAATLIAGSSLAEQIESLRITPETLTTEEIYRLWAAFQTSYRPSTALQVSVIVIKDTAQFAAGPPVQTRTVVTQPLNAPVIAAVTPATVAAGGQLTITGRNFIGDAATKTLVSFDGQPGAPPDLLQPQFITVTVPAAVPAGTHTLRVQRTILFPGSSVPHAGITSSASPFQLIPTIENPSPVAATQGSPLVLTISPAVGRGQTATLYVGDTALPIDQRPVAGPATSTTLTFPIPATLPTGTYPLRVEIDGAQSPPGPQVQVSP